MGRIFKVTRERVRQIEAKAVAQAAAPGAQLRAGGVRRRQPADSGRGSVGRAARRSAAWRRKRRATANRAVARRASCAAFFAAREPLRMASPGLHRAVGRSRPLSRSASLRYNERRSPRMHDARSSPSRETSMAVSAELLATAAPHPPPTGRPARTPGARPAADARPRGERRQARSRARRRAGRGEAGQGHRRPQAARPQGQREPHRRLEGEAQHVQLATKSFRR